MVDRSVAIIGTRGYPSYYGGFETAVRVLAPWLADRNWDVSVYGRPGSQQASGGDPRVRVINTPGFETRSLSTLSYGFTSSAHAAVRRPSVALVMNVANGYWLPMLKSRGIPTTVNVDGIEWEREKWSRTAQRVFRRGAQMTARFGDELIFDSEVIASRWAREFHRDGHFIPYGGSPSDHHVPLPFGLSKRGYALVVARFVPENTIAEFFDAAERIAEKYPVVIVGSSGYGGELEARASGLSDRYERVIWTGHMSDDALLHSLWANAGAYFHGHSVGGTNPALVQAMASGAPTVARDTAYNREVLSDAGVFVAPYATEISSAMLRLLESPSEQQRLSARGRERALSRYSWESVCAGYEAVIEKAMERRLS